MARLWTRPSFVLLAVVVLSVTASASEVDRLARLARVWAAVKYLHPFLLEKQIDWDGALVRAIPKVRAASTDEDFASAVRSMLAELGDPATRVVQATPGSPVPGGAVLTRWVGDTLVINAGPYAAAKGGMALLGERANLSKEIAKARQVVVDVRYHGDNPEERAVAAYAISELRGLTNAAVSAPASVYVYHSGYRPQQATSSGGYYSGFLTVPGPTFGAASATAPSRIVFVADAQSRVPAIAVALQYAGKALIASDAPVGDHQVASSKTIELGGTWRALVRVERISAAVEADAIAADPMAEALAILENGKAAPAPRRTQPGRSSTEPVWRPDADYRDMVYPDVAHRLLAAFRIWSVIEYFYPYKALIGDWGAALTESIPQFVAAGNEEEYAAAVLQMVARVEDGHSGAYGHPAVAKILGGWRTPIEVREVEKEFVVTRLHAVPADAGSDVHVGDVVLSVDGEPFLERVSRLRKYVTASTETARRNRLAAIALQGPANSIATLTVRSADERTRTVQIPRAQVIQPRVSGEPYHIMDGNIGYVDLTRLEVPEVDAMFDALKGASAIVFDMRGYPRGTAWSIAPRINTKDAKIGAVFRRAQVSGVNSFEESASGFYFEQPLPTSEKPKYTGKLLMLIDDRAISQAEHTCLFFEAASDVTFVGTPTAGANGDVTSFFLPGGFRVGFTGHDVRHADGRQLQRVGIQPHVHVTPTISGIRSGRDEVLERAIAYLKQPTR